MTNAGWVLAIHGGAGDGPRGGTAAVDAGLEAALDAGWDARPGGPLDAAIGAVRALEDDVTFNAGHGAVRTADGRVELDAAVMSGSDLSVGAVGAVSDVPNPVLLARAVMEQSAHVLLVGPGASRFATEHDVHRCEPDELETAARPLPGGDTVGAVCRAPDGRVAVAVSTGGVPGKLSGRLGDSPVCGAGFFADDRSAAACCTGDGEAFIRAAVAVRLCDAVAAGQPVEAAARSALARIDGLGTGGVIAVDAHSGAIAITHSSPHMSWAWRDAARSARWSRP